MTKDFTPEEAKRWVSEELAKCPTPEIMRKRLESEEGLVAMIEGKDFAKGLPNSLRAHKDLIEALRNALKVTA